MNGHHMDWLIRQAFGVLAVAMVFGATHLLLRMGNTNICERGIVDPTLTTPVIVEHGGGRISVEEVPRFTTERPFEDTGVFYMVALFFAAVVWLVVTGG